MNKRQREALIARLGLLMPDTPELVPQIVDLVAQSQEVVDAMSDIHANHGGLLTPRLQLAFGHLTKEVNRWIET